MKFKLVTKDVYIQQYISMISTQPHGNVTNRRIFVKKTRKKKITVFGEKTIQNYVLACLYMGVDMIFTYVSVKTF